MLCECGCRQTTSLARKTAARFGHVKGQPLRFIHGHNARHIIPDVPNKPCECGCGQITKRARKSDTRFGHLNGHPQRFAQGHNSRTKVRREWVDNRGYVMVWVPGKGNTRRSHVVAEKMLRHPLDPTEEVHHVNGIKTDDRPENLMVVTHVEHMRIHLKGVPLSRAPRDALSAARKNRGSVSDATRCKLSLAHKGRKPSEETRAKMKLAAIAREQKKRDSQKEDI